MLLLVSDIFEGPDLFLRSLLLNYAVCNKNIITIDHANNPGSSEVLIALSRELAVFGMNYVGPEATSCGDIFCSCVRLLSIQNI